MGNLGNFNANDVEPNKPREALPAGEYLVVISKSDMKPTKAGTGHYLELQLQVLEGEHANRIVFDRLNLDNPNQTAVEIAQGTLSAICRAVGVMTPSDSAELHDLPLIAVVKLTTNHRGEPANEVKGYKPKEQGPTPAPAGDGKPWQKQA